MTWALSVPDPNLVVIELDPDTRTPEWIDSIHAAGKLASENAWELAWDGEMLADRCEAVFDLKIDIAISKQAAGCADARTRRETSQ